MYSKIDLMKAYDSLEWEFILRSLLCFGIPGPFVAWIRVCRTNPKFSIFVNGTLVGYFDGRRRLRQGDPLSPYLFVIAMEILTVTRLMAEVVLQMRGFEYHHL
jgi:hypothetical protein